MAIREVLLDVGEGAVTLDEHTPEPLLPDVDGPHGGFSLIVVTPVRLRPSHVDADTVLAHSMYTGVIRGVKRDGESGRTEVRFTSPLILSGDEDSKGDSPIAASGGATITPRPFWNGPNKTSYVEAWRTRAQGLTVHSSTPVASGPAEVVAVDEGATGLAILRSGCRGAFSTWREFYLDPQLALHADTAAALFRAGHVVVQPALEGPLADGRWCLPARLVDDGDLEDWTRTVIVNNGASISGTSTDTTTFRAPDGDMLAMTRVIQSTAPPSNPAAAQVAATQRNRFKDPKHLIAFRTGSPLARLQVMPGDWVHCFDRDAGVFDLGNPSLVGGKVLPLVTGVRCEAIRWNVEAEQGVYLLHRVMTPWPGWGCDDWSPHFVPEPPGADLEVGALMRTLGASGYRPPRLAVS